MTMKETFHILLIVSVVFLKSLYKFESNGNLSNAIVLKGFLYPNNLIFDKQRKNSILIFALVNKANEFRPCCILGSPYGTSEQILSHFEPISKELNATGLRLFTFICSTNNIIVSSEIRLNRKSPIILPDFTRVDPIKRKLIFCPGFLTIATVNIELFITIMEILRLHRIDLVIIHVRNYEIEFKQIIASYIQDGLLELRADLVPLNKEIEVDSIIMNQYDCLYEFKENTEFISFMDWNEFPITKEWNPLLSLISDNSFHIQIEEKNPNKIIINKKEATMVANEGNILNVWTNGFIISEGNKQNLKPQCFSLIRPKYTNSLETLNECEGMQISDQQVFVLKIINKIEQNFTESNYNASMKITLQQLIPKFKQLFENEQGLNFKKLYNIVNATEHTNLIEEINGGHFNKKCYKINNKLLSINAGHFNLKLIKLEQFSRFIYKC